MCGRMQALDCAFSECDLADGSRSKFSQSSTAPTVLNCSNTQYINTPSENADTLAQGFTDMCFPEHPVTESNEGRMQQTHHMWLPYIGRPSECPQQPPLHHMDKQMRASDDPLMCDVSQARQFVPMPARTSHTQQLPMMPPGSCPTMPPLPRGPTEFTGGFPYIDSHPGGQTATKRANDNVKDPARRGPLASPNTHTSLLPTNRHMAYPKAPDHLVQPLAMVAGGDQTALQCMEAADNRLGDCVLLSPAIT
jgi:hypothetical protein